MRASGSKQQGGDGARLAMTELAGRDTTSASMAVSIAGVSTACSKDALASSAKAVREALSTD